MLIGHADFSMLMQMQSPCTDMYRVIWRVKMKRPIVIEKHAYAPEMNKAYRVVNGKMVLIAKAMDGGLLAKGFDSIRSLRERFQPVRQGIVATLKTHYPSELQWLERTYCGYVSSRSEAIKFAEQLRTKLAEGGRVSIKTQIVG